MTEIQQDIQPRTLETDRPDLKLVQMLSDADDKTFFELQNANLDYWKEFDNTIDESLEEVTERRLEHGDNRYGIWLADKLIGIVGCSTKKHDNEAEIGILMDKAASGHGYAKSAVMALTEFAKPRFNRVYAEVPPDNDRSIDLFNNAGFQSNGEIAERDWGLALVFETTK